MKGRDWFYLALVSLNFAVWALTDQIEAVVTFWGLMILWKLEDQ